MHFSWFNNNDNNNDNFQRNAMHFLKFLCVWFVELFSKSQSPWNKLQARNLYIEKNKKRP